MEATNRYVGLERGLWISFVALFLGMVATAWLPVRPILIGLPFWTVAALVLMIASVIVAGIAGGYYGWPANTR